MVYPADGPAPHPGNPKEESNVCAYVSLAPFNTWIKTFPVIRVLQNK